MGKRTSHTWLSLGLESVAQRNSQRDDPELQLNNFDVVIVGSGYGGAVAAYVLSQAKNANGEKLKIAVFEHGREYIQGSFPANVEETPKHIRFSLQNSKGPAGPRDGLFDFRFGRDLNVVVANGVGGGSLINAGVMLRPEHKVFDHRWPSTVRAEDLASFYDHAELLLGVRTASSQKNSIDLHQHQGKIKKLAALKHLAGHAGCSPTPLSIPMQAEANYAGVALNACTLCGDCAAGCNHGAKNSLDQNLLKLAVDNGVTLISGATANSIKKLADRRWEVCFHYTDDKLNRTQKPVPIVSDKVILAAGSLGTTELLLRAQAQGQLQLSTQLGRKFSSNGDNFIAHYAQDNQSNAIAFEYQAPSKRFIGPTITGMIDRRASDGVVIQEMSVAAHLNRLFTEVCSTMHGVYDFSRVDKEPHESTIEAKDRFTVDQAAFTYTSVYAVMGDDDSGGRLELCDGYREHSDSCLSINWPALKSHELFERQLNLVESLVDDNDAGGTVIPNPVWKLLPTSLMQLVGNQKGPTVTVHPLGGCAMAESPKQGVADQYGRVFDLSDTDSGGENTRVHQSLVVMDGSILPTALGINPALTIAALALRNSHYLLEHWGWRHATNPEPVTPRQLPVVRELSEVAHNPPATTFTMLERLRGYGRCATNLPGSSNDDDHSLVIEITLKTAGNDLTPNGYPDKQGEPNNWKHHPLITNTSDSVSNPQCYLRIFKQADWARLSNACKETEATEQALDQLCIFKAVVTGDIYLFAQGESSAAERIRAASYAWLFNRGIRDVGQFLFPRYYEKPGKPIDRSTFKPVASRAGSRWLINYQLSLGKVLKNSLRLRPKSNRIVGEKTITYARRANPWRQLTEVALVEFLGLEMEPHPVLRLDTEFLADRATPLYEFQTQANQVRAGLDAFSFGMYTLRLLLHTHLWSFRLPDRRLPDKVEVPSYPRAAVVNRLARGEPGLATPDYYFLTIRPDSESASFQPSHTQNYSEIGARLAHYHAENGETSRKRPLLMLHGYSASSTTFSHPALTHSATRYFLERGRDVWLIDLRSSAGLPGASSFWHFDDIASTEIHQALRFIHEFYQRSESIDIVAHCMGAAMLCMTLCDSQNSYEEDQLHLHAIGKIAFSQFSPTPVFTPFNTLRAMTVNATKSLFKGSYAFRGERGRNMIGDLLDRFLSTLPASDAEFDRMNPSNPFSRRTYSRSKQRADALYSRVLNISEMGHVQLNHFDDFFGPLNLETATQVMHFARSNRITNFRGHANYIEPAILRRKWPYPTLSLHSQRNGMIDRRSGATAETVFRKAGANYRAVTLENSALGHQDAMIGNNAARDVFPVIADFLDDVSELPQSSNEADLALWRVELADKGPVVFKASNGAIRIGFGVDEKNAALRLPILIPLGDQQGAADQTRESIRIVIEKTLHYARCWRDCKISPSWYVLDLSALLNDSVYVGRTNFLLYLASDESGLFPVEFEKTNSGASDGFAGLSLGLPECAERDSIYEQQLTALSIEVARTISGGEESAGDLASLSIPGGDQQTLSFAFGSCQYPSGLFDRTLAYRSYAALANQLSSSSTGLPDFLILMGDQIYSDATAGFMDPRTRYDRYARPHLNWYAQPEVKRVMRRLPLYAMLDDHEILDNWDPALNNEQEAKENSHPALEKSITAAPASQTAPQNYLAHGVSAFKKFQRGQIDKESAHCWYEFEEAGSPFLMLDTRTERSTRSAETFSYHDQILGDEQQRSLEQWLLRTATSHAGEPKFVVSPSILLPRHAVNHGAPENGKAPRPAANWIHSDSWDGFPGSLYRVLAFLCEHSIEDIYFLSGDEHLNCYALVELESDDGKRIKLRSIHCSGLYAPIPFANARESDFIGTPARIELEGKTHSVLQDSFEFSHRGNDQGLTRYRCSCRYGFDLELGSSIDSESLLSIKTLEGFGLVQRKPRRE